MYSEQLRKQQEELQPKFIRNQLIYRFVLLAQVTNKGTDTQTISFGYRRNTDDIRDCKRFAILQVILQIFFLVNWLLKVETN